MAGEMQDGAGVQWVASNPLKSFRDDREIVLPCARLNFFGVHSSILCSALPPLFLFGVTGLARCLMDHEFSARQFWLGLELTIGALAATLDFQIDLHLHQQRAQDSFRSMLVILGCILWLLVMLNMHREFGAKDSQKKRAQVLWLLVLGNVVGGGLLFMFSTLVKE